MNKQEQQVTKDMLISEIVELVPGSQELITMAGLHCVGCVASKFESLEMGMRGHGYTDEEINELVQELNLLWQESQEDEEQGNTEPTLEEIHDREEEEVDEY